MYDLTSNDLRYRINYVYVGSGATASGTFTIRFSHHVYCTRTCTGQHLFGIWHGICGACDMCGSVAGCTVQSESSCLLHSTRTSKSTMQVTSCALWQAGTAQHNKPCARGGRLWCARVVGTYSRCATVSRFGRMDDGPLGPAKEWLSQVRRSLA